MRVVIQRASCAHVNIHGKVHAEIGPGMVILLGIEISDDNDDLEWICKKIISMRIFSDVEGKMNIAINDVSGDILVISQFTLHASTKKGNRPSFIKAARPDQAIPLYERFIARLSARTTGNVKSGKFGADMKVQLTNDGPVTIILDSKQRD